MARGEECFYDLTPSWLPFDKDVYTLSCCTHPDPQLQQFVDKLARNQDKQDTADGSEPFLLEKSISKPSADQPDSKVAGKSNHQTGC